MYHDTNGCSKKATHLVTFVYQSQRSRTFLSLSTATRLRAGRSRPARICVLPIAWAMITRRSFFKLEWSGRYTDHSFLRSAEVTRKATPPLPLLFSDVVHT